MPYYEINLGNIPLINNTINNNTSQKLIVNNSSPETLNSHWKYLKSV
ncbi:hypothetical protein AQPE_0529 [Aquipluma nitroreducens]|uniref:Uncharacterized protein n=1 Tax=Aquipluma nitroreducens TaxID=2010828 RepID=A0A5K7S495_9BACT|nr:hypothetical protein AQPE_0529 [Aquipluma nitroreducens]